MKWRSIKILCFFVLLAGIFVVESTNANAATKKFTDSKVKKVIVKKSTGTYKSWDWDSKKKDYTVQKFKYTKGYNLSWKKIKGATGYKITVYRYSPVREKYVVIKTKNVKKTKYLLTDIVKGETYKYTIQAYKGSSDNRKYSKCSKKFSFKPKLSCYVIKTDKNHNTIYNPNYNRFEAEKAFVIQNQYRKEKGLPLLKWSEEMYNVAKIRCEELIYIRDNDLDLDPHDRPDGTWFINTFKDYFGIEKYREFSELCGNIPFAENCAIGQMGAEDVMRSWKESKGHHENLLNEDWMSGAIVCFCDGNGIYWYSVFSRCVIE